MMKDICTLIFRRNNSPWIWNTLTLLLYVLSALNVFADCIGADTKPDTLTITGINPSTLQAPSPAITFQVNFSFTFTPPNTGSISFVQPGAFGVNWGGKVAATLTPTAADLNQGSTTDGFLRFQAPSPLLQDPQTVSIRILATFCNTDLGTQQSDASSIQILGNNPLPSISSLEPASALVGAPDTALVVVGQNFVEGSVVKWGDVSLPTVFQGHTQLSAEISADKLASAKTADITVFNPAPGGGTSNMMSFTVTPRDVYDLAIPVILSVHGKNNSFFTSEMTLANRGNQDAILDYTYTRAEDFGGGQYMASEVLPAGHQRVVADALDHLSDLNSSIPRSGDRLGTLSVHFGGIASAEGAVVVRTTTPVANGRAGLAYTGVPLGAAIHETSYLCGLRENATDRSNIALQNLGSSDDGDVVLRLTVFSGDPQSQTEKTLSDLRLPPGGWKQLSSVLASEGLSIVNGYVRVQLVSGTAPYYAYGVINDQITSDGSFIPPVAESVMNGRQGVTVPVIVETSSYDSELVLTNWSTSARRLQFSFVADSIQTANKTASFALSLQPGEQRIIPHLVQWMRDNGVEGISGNSSYAGPLFATVDGGDASGIFLGARTSTVGGSGHYGVFYAGVPYGLSSTDSAWIFGLQQNPENRSNIGLVNTGEIDSSSSSLNIEIYDGDTGALVGTVPVSLNARSWIQMGSILARFSPPPKQAYAHVVRISGTNPFLAYGVINDGGQPNQRTGDGAFVPSSP
ncbi:MAG TPA: hypothetical protein VMW38_17125 [Terriglobia bacterium]|nr:hypothetical protein [Terriglobia bacterium]